MTDQIEVQEKVRWEDLEVVEEQDECQGCFDPLCGIDYAKPGSDVTVLTALKQGVLLVFGISAEEFAEAIEGRARAALEQELRFAEVPVLGAVDCNNWREANERLPKISEMVARINAFCTPSKNILTGE